MTHPATKYTDEDIETARALVEVAAAKGHKQYRSAAAYLGTSESAVRCMLQRQDGKRRKTTPTTVRDVELPPAEPANDNDGLERILFVPDAHVPFESAAAWAVMMGAARAFRPHRVVVLGDLADFWSVSAHSKDPRRRDDLTTEVAAVRSRLAELESLGADKLHFVEGNHEHRLQRYLHDKAPALATSLSVPVLFELQAHGWTFTPYRQHLKIGKLHVTHECGNAGPVAHARARDTFGGNVVIGHTHRMATSYAGTARGEAHVGAMFGWLGDPDAIDYAHRVQVSQWQHGFGLGWMQPSGTVHLQAVPIVNGQCVVGGVVVG